MIGRRGSRAPVATDPGGPTRPSPFSAERDTDAARWAATRAGCTDAFGELFDRHADAVYRYAMVRLRDPFAAEEITSMAFAEAWRQRHSVELLDGSLRPWLIGVARNQANRAIRLQERQLRRDRSLVPTVASDHANAVAAGVDAARQLPAVLEAIDALPTEGRETLVLHVWGELTHEQIAHELGVSVGTVKSRLHRARSRLAAVLDEPTAVEGRRGPRAEVAAATSVPGAGGR